MKRTGPDQFDKFPHNSVHEKPSLVLCNDSRVVEFPNVKSSGILMRP